MGLNEKCCISKRSHAYYMYVECRLYIITYRHSKRQSRAHSHHQTCHLGYGTRKRSCKGPNVIHHLTRIHLHQVRLKSSKLEQRCKEKVINVDLCDFAEIISWHFFITFHADKEISSCLSSCFKWMLPSENSLQKCQQIRNEKLRSK